MSLIVCSEVQVCEKLAVTDTSTVLKNELWTVEEMDIEVDVPTVSDPESVRVIGLDVAFATAVESATGGP
ncbi:hypothetical protein EBO15_20705 [Actinomadura harenae]|uniref:Uncharacterized protein n=1 Tax=Actinomadura harenae TaxID=2483351 RepID=A0A3M2LWY6_9ACTN|nr:hypothetical protein EBO15_20705 [Actinomadura harenae]